MTYSFIAYIDESGDDGLRSFKSAQNSNGSSQWLAISCHIIRATNHLECVKWRDDIKGSIKRHNTQNKKREIHFRELCHNRKIVVCKELADLPMRTITILCNKSAISNKKNYAKKNHLYHYITRYLIERISWFCRDMRPKVKEGNGSVKIIFSRRGGMNYDDFRNYMVRLRESKDTTIHWNSIDIDEIEAIDHSKNAGLQLADIVASAFYSAVEPNEYGNCEGRYAKYLLKNIYRRNGQVLNYGIKIYPSNIDNMLLNSDQKEFLEILSEVKEEGGSSLAHVPLPK